jgi:predicted ATPase
MTEVWPDVVVEENNLQVQVSALRKALGAAGPGRKYLVTVAGRGYRFVAPVERTNGAFRARLEPSRADPSAIQATSNLPQRVTALIGRQAELSEIKTRLASNRLVTLSGAGGVGKTRLAVEAGNSLLKEYADGVWFVELAPISNAELVASVIADTAGASAGAPDFGHQALAAALRHKQLLLIIDNCEHVIGEVARVVEALMQKCPRLSVLATSRERLAIPGERVIRVPSLPTPKSGAIATADEARGYAAVQLFAERANALGLAFALTDGNAGIVSSICRRLDGIPLAVELAVPRLNVMSIEQLERRIDERFNLLTAGTRTALPRQQT